MSTTPVVQFTGTPVAVAGPVITATDVAELRSYRSMYDHIQEAIAKAERIRTALRTLSGVLLAERAVENVAHPASKALDAAEQNVAALRRKEALLLTRALGRGIDLELDADLR